MSRSSESLKTTASSPREGKAVGISEDHGVVAERGQGGGASSGVNDWGTYEKDDPGTWEALISP
jgi:hypothetical protein